MIAKPKEVIKKIATWIMIIFIIFLMIVIGFVIVYALAVTGLMVTIEQIVGALALASYFGLVMLFFVVPVIILFFFVRNVALNKSFSMKEKMGRFVSLFILGILPCVFIGAFMISYSVFPSLMPSMTFLIFLFVWILALCTWILGKEWKKKQSVWSFISKFWSVIVVVIMIVFILIIVLLS